MFYENIESAEDFYGPLKSAIEMLNLFIDYIRCKYATTMKNIQYNRIHSLTTSGRKIANFFLLELAKMF